MSFEDNTVTMTTMAIITGTTDEELAAKLEEANRLLESDAKSLKSLSTPSESSRRGSDSSLKSTSSIASHLSSTCEIPEDSWVIWGRIVNDWDDIYKKKTRFVKDLVRRGIPHHFRGIVWQLMCRAHDSPLKEKYVEYLKMSSPCEKVIRRDIARTYPEHEFFKEKDGPGQEVLFNVMKAYSLHDREVGYCQGCGFIVGLLLMQMPEEEAFCVVVKLMQDYRLRELFKPSMAELGLCMFQLENLIQEHLPDLYFHFQTQSFYTSMYASPWFLTLFATSLSLSLSCRIMDVFISEGMETIFRVGMAILTDSAPQLLQLDMEGMLRYFQHGVPEKYDQDKDGLMNLSYQIKINSKRIKKLEKEYLAIKTKETEEQIEMRRLRTENRLLRQRIEVLEKESAALADRLIQGQVTRAQEAEEKYGIKKELAALRQNEEQTNERLQAAQEVITSLKNKPKLQSSKAQEEMDSVVTALQEELIAVKLREAESSASLRELADKVQELEEQNKEIVEQPSYNVASMQEELIAVKLREAEANLSLKEMRQKVADLEEHWHRHLQRTVLRRNETNKKNNVYLQDELMTLKLREAESYASLKETKQRVMELQTLNQVCSNQLRRSEEERIHLKEFLEASEKREQKLQQQLNEGNKKLAYLEAKSQEDLVSFRLKRAEMNTQMVEMQQRIAELEIQKQVDLTKGELNDSETDQTIKELQYRITDLQAEVLQLRIKAKAKSSFLPFKDVVTMATYDYDDDEEDFSDIAAGIDVSQLDSSNDSNRLYKIRDMVENDIQKATEKENVSA
ncbi:ecotropic viral integration site 5 protein homolog [Saccoglossus kowalevskii]|uniref:EVI5-like protein-like isoform X1 n=1 Tax=Saccoglossus kowalevskii TaxID=10224 RepID=A0ABM0MDB7_SACKO|nr:PREDICTED: EVI5-like protein-like isoform X1 [Saccoglossus kowalevskii]XP_006818008.1 PREDICTED: EVI5-like protein-like isoform X2 [Saccoglossus kowalevskii]